MRTWSTPLPPQQRPWGLGSRGALRSPLPHRDLQDGGDDHQHPVAWGARGVHWVEGCGVSGP